MGLLTVMAEQQRRRPQEQAAVLVAEALAAWAEDAYAGTDAGAELEAEP